MSRQLDQLKAYWNPLKSHLDAFDVSTDLVSITIARSIKEVFDDSVLIVYLAKWIADDRLGKRSLTRTDSDYG